jgi:hypothetical protein
MPNIPWSPWNRFICTRSAPRPGGKAVLGDGGTIIIPGLRPLPGRADAIGASGRPRKGVVADRFARPHLVLRAGTGTATGRPTLCTTAANRHSRPACSPYPGRWQRLAGTSACAAVRGRSVLRCSGRANHQDPVTPPNLPGGKPDSGPPLGRIFRSGWTWARPPGVPPGEIEPKGEPRASSSERTLEAILGSQPCPSVATSASSDGCSGS